MNENRETTKGAPPEERDELKVARQCVGLLTGALDSWRVTKNNVNTGRDDIGRKAQE